jgi:hypothetical protein
MISNANTNRLLASVLVLQVLTVAGQWGGSATSATPAHADLPDPGAQRLAAVDELKTLNGKMDRLLAVLEGGKMRVEVVNPDDKKK